MNACGGMVSGAFKTVRGASLFGCNGDGDGD
jgi:hypothetical protein